MHKQPGDAIFAGSVNQEGILEVRTEGVGADTSYGKIISAVEHAQERKAPAEKQSERVSRWLVSFALCAAAATYALAHDPSAAVAVRPPASVCVLAV